MTRKAVFRVKDLFYVAVNFLAFFIHSICQFTHFDKICMIILIIIFFQKINFKFIYENPFLLNVPELSRINIFKTFIGKRWDKISDS